MTAASMNQFFPAGLWLRKWSHARQAEPCPTQPAKRGGTLGKKDGDEDNGPEGESDVHRDGLDLDVVPHLLLEAGGGGRRQRTGGGPHRLR